MIRIENHCAGCTELGMHCLGKFCSNIDVEVCYCDKCGEEVEPDEIFEVDGEQICYECRLEMLAEEDEEEELECCV